MYGWMAERLSGMGGTPQAFLSYTRLDDQGHDGGITALRAALELQVRIVTGDDSFEIFQDVDGIAFGEHWPKRLDQELAASRFLIPVLSPRFFRSTPCRDELRKFLAHEQAAGRDDLILPIYLVEAPVLERPHLTAADDLAAAIAQRQRWDWRPHAFAAATEPAVRRALRELATAIGRRLDQEGAAPPLSVQPPVSSPSADPTDDPPPGRGIPRRRRALVPGAGGDPRRLVHDGLARDARRSRCDNEGPQRQVTFARPFAMGRYTVTRGQFGSFVAATKHDMSGGAQSGRVRNWS